MKTPQLARLAEIGLRREEGHAREAVLAPRREQRGRDGEQRASDAIPGCVHLALRHDGVDGVERRKDAVRQVIVHRQVAIGDLGFFHEIMNTVWPRPVRYLTSEFRGDRSRM